MWNTGREEREGAKQNEKKMNGERETNKDVNRSKRPMKLDTSLPVCFCGCGGVWKRNLFCPAVCVTPEIWSI